MEKHIIDGRTGISYTLVGDYYFPDFALSLEVEHQIGTYGRKHLKYIKEHKKELYSSLLSEGKLYSYLTDMDEQATETRDRLMKQMAKAQGITEQMKNEDPLSWVGRMNSIKACVDEIILNEIVFVWGLRE